MIVHFGKTPASDYAQIKMDTDSSDAVSSYSLQPSTSLLVSRRQTTFLRAMNTMRRENQLCDVTLTAENKQLQAHRVILAAASNFFHAMFTSRMAEANSTLVDLQDIAYSTVEAIVDYAYTAQIEITDENVQELLSAANLYQISEIKEACCTHLRAQLSATNCLGIRDFAEFHHCKELNEAAVQFVDENFTDVCTSEEFLQLSQVALTELLDRDELTVRCEDEVYDAAVSWIRYDDTRVAQKTAVLSTVRFPLISKHYLTTHIKHEPLLQDCCQCLRMIIDGMQRHLVSESDEENSSLKNVRPRTKKFCYQIALFSGSDPATCQYFDPKDCSWQNFPAMPERRRDHSVALIKNKVFIIGGSYLFPISRIDIYDVISQKWSTSRSRLLTSRDSLAVCAHREVIYISGGTQSHGSTAMRLMECYTPASDNMDELCPMIQPRFDHGLVLCGDFLYACGGSININSKPLKHCEKYSHKLNKWTEVVPLATPRRLAGFAAHNGKIYAFGGMDEAGCLDSVECYDPISNRWTQKARIPFKLRNVKCGVVNDSVWIVAAGLQKGHLKNILEYRVLEDRWVVQMALPAFQHCNAAVVTVDTCVLG